MKERHAYWCRSFHVTVILCFLFYFIISVCIVVIFSVHDENLSIYYYKCRCYLTRKNDTQAGGIKKYPFPFTIISWLIDRDKRCRGGCYLIIATIYYSDSTRRKQVVYKLPGSQNIRILRSSWFCSRLISRNVAADANRLLETTCIRNKIYGAGISVSGSWIVQKCLFTITIMLRAN